MNTEKIESPKSNGLIKTSSQSWINAMTSRTEEIDTAFRKTVQANPALAALCALGVGVIAGLVYEKLVSKKGAST